jgi:RNA polymerase sigma-B factor
MSALPTAPTTAREQPQQPQWQRRDQGNRQDREQDREAVIREHHGLVKSIAARFSARGEPLEDLIQVGTIGLIKVVDRYDPDQGARFSTFATPTILGEIQRYFRDKTSLIRVPRSLQEQAQAAWRTQDILAHQLGRRPTLSEVAVRLNTCEEALSEALAAAQAGRNVSSLDAAPPSTNLAGSSSGGGGAVSAPERIGCLDNALEASHAYGDLIAAVQGLPDKESQVLRLRFFEEWSQSQIARQMNCSQMQVSRLQRHGLNRLRARLRDWNR